LLVDSTGLRLCGPGEWLVENHGTQKRRSWRKLYIGVDADTGEILASELTTSDVNDGSQVEPLLDQIQGPLTSIGEGAYDQAGIYGTIGKRHPEADVIVPPGSTAVPSEMAERAPTQRDRHLQNIAEHGCMGRQTRSGYTRRALVEASISRFRRVIGDALRSRTDRRRATEIAIAMAALNGMLELGHPKSTVLPKQRHGVDSVRSPADPCNMVAQPSFAIELRLPNRPFVQQSHLARLQCLRIPSAGARYFGLFYSSA
jgi:Transposase DDE domain